MKKELGFKDMGRERAYAGFIKVDKITLTQEKPDGEWTAPFTREVINRGHAAAVLIRDPLTDRVLFTKQFRPGSYVNGQPWMYELVAGMLDGNEDPVETIKRESMEEASVGDLDNIELISTYYPSCGACSEVVSLYYAEADLSGLGGYAGCSTENEIIEIVTFSVDEAFELLKSGKLNTSINNVALFWLMANRK